MVDNQSPVAEFTWLHLTDLHAGMLNQDWLWPTLKHEFFKDLTKVHSLTGNWDIVIFSGDLTQRGTRDDFDQLDQILSDLWAHFQRLGCSPPLFVLPGNHDLQRPTLTARFRTLKRWWDEPDIHREFFSAPENEYRVASDFTFKEYLDWVDRGCVNGPKLLVGTKGLLPGDQAHVFDKGELRIGLVGLNSTWLQIDNADYLGRLHIDTKQPLSVTSNDPESWCRANTFNLLVTHHPLTWLHQQSQNYWNSEINPPGRFTAHMFGLACTRFRRHRVRCFDGTGGGSWRDGSLRGSSSLRPCG
jgi:Calcineurin-like phosphoesterase